MSGPDRARSRTSRTGIQAKIAFFVFVSTCVTALAMTGISAWSGYAAHRGQTDAAYLDLFDWGAHLGAGAVLALLSTLAGAAIVSRVVRPIWRLFDGAHRIAKGELDIEISVEGADEDLARLIDAFNAMACGLGKARARVEASERALQQQNAVLRERQSSLERLSTTDGLTQLYNHRHFQDQLGREIQRQKRAGGSLALLILDLDDFKQMNDSYGHAAGDEFLVQTARILSQYIRATDLLARYGGEEFVVIATTTTLEGATILAEKLRTAVAEASFIVDATMRPRSVTVSVGVAEYSGDRALLFVEADDALYQAKSAGKNCVVAYGAS